MTSIADLGEDAQFEYDPVGHLLTRLEISHNRRFDCDDYDPAASDTDDELVVHCESCRFVVSRFNKPDGQ
jgi:hypothetical protein